MKLTYLGTAAAEGMPAVFCRCEYCVEARRLGGKNIRTRSQALVNDDLLVDLPPDTYHHFLTQGIEGDKVAHLLITHGHSDHLYPTELEMREIGYAHKHQAPILTVYGSAKTIATIRESIRVPSNVVLTTLTPFTPTAVGDYVVTAFPARHMPGGEPLFYLIERDKTLLYANDTGYFFDEVFAYLEEKRIRLDMVSYDCTFGDLPIPDDGHHMGFPNIARVQKRLCAIGAIDEDTVQYVHHFSHNAAPLHDAFVKRAADIGCGCSFDGCVVEF
ncbi:MAG: hypothetical protein E7552_06950 [Ruminococcaceae bacterium]|nr:hypothetical protein [Oscillospiraceae bacterium]